MKHLIRWAVAMVSMTVVDYPIMIFAGFRSQVAIFVASLSATIIMAVGGWLHMMICMNVGKINVSIFFLFITAAVALMTDMVFMNHSIFGVVFSIALIAMFAGAAQNQVKIRFHWVFLILLLEGVVIFAILNYSQVLLVR